LYSSSGSTTCVTCTIGLFSAAGSSSCSSCSPGKYGASAGLSACDDCPTGQYSGLPACTNCTICPLSTYSSVVGQSACTGCPLNAITSSQESYSVSKCLCPDGFYGKASQNESCKTCGNSQGIKCPFNSPLPYVLPGYYRGSQPATIYRCVPFDACVQTEYSESTQCATGYTGDVCGQCILGSYYRLGLNCKKCPNPAFKYLGLVVVLVFIIGVTSTIMFRQSSSGLPVEIKFGFLGIQLLGLFPSLSSSWPPGLSGILNAFSLSNLDIDLFAPGKLYLLFVFFRQLCVECSVPLSFWTKYYLKMTFPLILLGLVIANCLAFALLSKFVWKKGVDFKFLRTRAITFLLQTVVSCYTLLISGAVSPFICLKQADGTEIMVKNPAITCTGGEWLKHYPVVMFLIILYGAFVPLSFLGLLVFNRNNLDDPDVQHYIGTFTRQYKPKFFWWDIIFLLKRALFVVISSLIPANPGNSAPYFGCIFLIFGYLCLEFFVHPYKRTIVAKRSAVWSLLAVMVLMADGLVFKSSSSSDITKYAYSIVMLLLILLAIATLMISIGQRFKRSWLKRQKKKMSHGASAGSVLAAGAIETSDAIEYTDPEVVMRIIAEMEELLNKDIPGISSVIIRRVNRNSLHSSVVMSPIVAKAKDKSLTETQSMGVLHAF
jgi:hypothetical protein